MKTVLKWVNKKNSNFPDFSKGSHFQSKKKKKKSFLGLRVLFGLIASM
jgi:hypothetical protein